MNDRYDLAIVGAGIVGLAHAWLAARAGARVVVVDRDAKANGASVRNFGFVTVTGQGWPETWRRAKRSRDLWAELAMAAGIPILHQGLVLAIHEGEGVLVAEAFLRTPMGDGCSLLDPGDIGRRFPAIRADGLVAGLFSPHELRVESRTAVPHIARFLAERHHVAFRWKTVVSGVDDAGLALSDGHIRADRVIVCPGTDLRTLYGGTFERRRVSLCTLHMLRLAPPSPDFRLGAAVMNDLSMVRYRGYAALPESERLRTVLEARFGPALDNGIHLIAVQSADGSLVVGDSHHYSDMADAFARDDVDQLILDQVRRTLRIEAPRVIERWLGTYPVAPDGDAFIEHLAPTVRLVSVTSGTGASTAFALAEEVLSGFDGRWTDAMRPTV